MLWLLSFPGVQLLLLMWVLPLIYTAFATLRSNMSDLVKALVIVLLFVSCYCTVNISQNWIGTPSITDGEEIGMLDGVANFEANNKHMMAIMVTTKTGPFMFAIPYEAGLEKDLMSSMKRRYVTGQLTMLRKRSKSSMEGGGLGQAELYDFTDQFLTPKPDPTR